MNVPIIGEKEVTQFQLNIANVCVPCFPKPQPAIAIFQGQSLCAKCLKEAKDNEKGEENVQPN